MFMSGVFLLCYYPSCHKCNTKTIPKQISFLFFACLHRTQIRVWQSLFEKLPLLEAVRRLAALPVAFPFQSSHSHRFCPHIFSLISYNTCHVLLDPGAQGCWLSYSFWDTIHSILVPGTVLNKSYLVQESLCKIQKSSRLRSNRNVKVKEQW